jgi:hypothetical protein
LHACIAATSLDFSAKVSSQDGYPPTWLSPPDSKAFFTAQQLDESVGGIRTTVRPRPVTAPETEQKSLLKRLWLQLARRHQRIGRPAENVAKTLNP